MYHVSVKIARETACKGELLSRYPATLANVRSKEKYNQKLKFFGGKDQYETSRDAWKDHVDLWTAVTYINVGMYLVFSPSPYTGDELMNYKNLECYQHFTAGWVRDILVAPERDKRFVTAKVDRSVRE